MAQLKRYLTTAETAQVIGMSESFLNQDRYYAKASGSAPKFPFIRIGRTIKYDRDVIATVMAERAVGE